MGQALCSGYTQGELNLKKLEKLPDAYIYCLHQTSKMSISSVGSTASVWVNGQQVPLEIQLEEVVAKMQNHLNRAQLHLREVAVVVEQDASMEEELKLSGDLDDELLEMQFLFDDMRAMCLG